MLNIAILFAPIAMKRKKKQYGGLHLTSGQSDSSNRFKVLRTTDYWLKVRLFLEMAAHSRHFLVRMIGSLGLVYTGLVWTGHKRLFGWVDGSGASAISVMDWWYTVFVWAINVYFGVRRLTDTKFVCSIVLHLTNPLKSKVTRHILFASNLKKVLTNAFTLNSG